MTATNGNTTTRENTGAQESVLVLAVLAILALVGCSHGALDLSLASPSPSVALPVLAIGFLIYEYGVPGNQTKAD